MQVSRLGRIRGIDICVRIDPYEGGVGVMSLDSGVRCQALRVSFFSETSWLAQPIERKLTHQRMIPSQSQRQRPLIRHTGHLVRH